jgi:hypothetical protein
MSAAPAHCDGRPRGGAPSRAQLLAALGLALALAALVVFVAPALAAPPPYVQAGEIPNAGSEFFSESVAVNPQNGHIYVADSGSHVIRDYASAGDTSPTVWNGSATPTGPYTGRLAVAVDDSTGDVYVADTTAKVIDKFDPDGNLIIAFGDHENAGTPEPDGTLAGLKTAAGSFSPASALAFGIAVDQETHDLYAIDAGHEVVDAFSSEGEYLPAKTITEKPAGLYGAEGAFTDGIAVDDTTGELLLTTASDVRLYRFELATGVSLGSINGSETPAGSFGGAYISVAVDPANGSVLVADSEHEVIDEFTPALTYAERQIGLGLSFVRGLGVDPQNGDVYAPDQASAAVRIFRIKPPAQPLAIASVTGVTNTTATLRGSVNPEGLATTYHFEYISQADWQANGGSFARPSPAFVLPVPDVSVGSGETAIEVSPQSLGGLIPGTTYRYRLVATNSLSPSGGTAGPEATFTTQPATAATSLLDGRQWQLVSPPDKHGALLEPINEAGVIQASRNGDAISYLANGPIEAEPSGSSNSVQILSRRLDSGWESQNIAGSNGAATGTAAGQGNESRFFSDDLSGSVAQPLGDFLPLSPAASEQTPYLRSDFPTGDLAEPCAQSCYRPLISGCPEAGPCPRPIEEAANVPPGTRFSNKREDATCGIGAGPARDSGFRCRPMFVGATPDLAHAVIESVVDLASDEPGATGHDLYEWGGGQLTRVGAIAGLGEEKFKSISADGSRIVFEGSSEGLSGLLLRDTAGARTVQLDAAAATCGTCTGGSGQFRFASADGSKVFFTDEKALTTDAGAKPGAADLYQCQVAGAPAAPRCELTDLTPAGSQAADVQGVLGAGSDGSWVYLAAGPADAPRLYVIHDGETDLIGALSAPDSHDWEHRLKYHTSRVAPDGEWLAFLSQQPLTGYDTHDALTGKPDMEVYLYDGAARRLYCASCNPSGARPDGVDYERIISGNGGLSGGNSILALLDQGVAAIIPGGTPVTGEQSLHQSRYLSNSGRLFFNSHDGLVPQDTNGTMDVYEYEPPNVGSCNEASPTFAPSNGGCVSLISSGTSPLESAFLDASENGNDVFFLTSARLAPQDTDSERDVYDAHVCTGEAPCLPEPPPAPPVCSGDACQLPATPPVDATPGSLTFSGAGNVVACPKGKVKKQGKCVKKKANKHKKKQHKKSKGKRKSTGNKKGAK